MLTLVISCHWQLTNRCIREKDQASSHSVTIALPFTTGNKMLCHVFVDLPFTLGNGMLLGGVYLPMLLLVASNKCTDKEDKEIKRQYFCV